MVFVGRVIGCHYPKAESPQPEAERPLRGGGHGRKAKAMIIWDVMLLWVTAAVALAVAAASWMRAARLARKLEALTQSYWELRYDFTRLRSQVARLDPETAAPEAPPAPQSAPATAFISLSSIKKKG